jgi:hypothetical protein
MPSARFEEKNVTQSFKSLTEIPKLPELVDDGINVREEVLVILLKFHLNMFLEGNVSFCHHLASVVCNQKQELPVAAMFVNRSR